MKYVLVLLALMSSTAQAEVLFKADYANQDFSQWSKYWQAQSVDRFGIVAAEEGASDLFAASYTVKYGDLHSNGARAEMVLYSPQFYEGDEVWFSWKTYFPEDFKSANRWHVWTQWHQQLPLGNGGPPVALILNGETLKLKVMGGYYDSIGDWRGGEFWVAPLKRGHWYTIVMHIKWSRGDDGFIEMWVDHQLVLPKKFHPNMDSDGVVYLKQGLYRDRSIAHDQTVYHDNMIVGTTREDVIPPLNPPQEEPPVEEPPTEEPPTQNPPGGGGVIDGPKPPTNPDTYPGKPEPISCSSTGSEGAMALIFAVLLLAMLPILTSRKY